MSDYKTILWQTEQDVITLTLNRPEKRNAFDEHMIAELTDAFAKIGQMDNIRTVFLQGAGTAFCAGGDLDWMRRMADYNFDENLTDARALAHLLQKIDECLVPTIALVHGAVFGGGLGLVAACDMAFATAETKFCLSEVKMGLIPATIAPYVVRAMGARAAHRYMLSAEIFNAEQAAAMGFIHGVIANIESEKTRLTALLNNNGPHAMRQTKILLCAVENSLINPELRDLTARMIAEARCHDEAKSRIQEFLKK